jgi:hypothetical protein
MPRDVHEGGESWRRSNPEGAGAVGLALGLGGQFRFQFFHTDAKLCRQVLVQLLRDLIDVLSLGGHVRAMFG